jgi:hypothetical protein
MKKIKIALFLVLAAMLILPSCKKGDNDPFFSFHSRKARVVGTWKLKSGSITENALTTELPYPNTPYAETMEFKKDFTFIITLIDTFGVTHVTTGAWAFSNKSKDIKLKNKEALILYPQTVTDASIHTYIWTGFYTDPVFWLLDRLANKEMVIKWNSTQTTPYSSDSYAGTKTYTQ